MDLYLFVYAFGCGRLFQLICRFDSIHSKRLVEHHHRWTHVARYKNGFQCVADSWNPFGQSLYNPFDEIESTKVYKFMTKLRCNRKETENGQQKHIFILIKCSLILFGFTFGIRMKSVLFCFSVHSQWSNEQQNTLSK